MVGAEVISRESLQQFAERLRPSGFRASTMLLAYGLAENGLAVTMTPLGKEPEFEVIHLETMQTLGIAKAVEHLNGANGTTRLVASVRRSLPETRVVVAGPAGERLSERQVGEIPVCIPRR